MTVTTSYNNSCLIFSFLYIRTRLSLEKELLHDETAKGSGSIEENKTDDSSGEGGGSGDENSSRTKQEPNRPVINQKRVKPVKPVSVQAPAKLSINKTNTKPLKRNIVQIQKKSIPVEAKKDAPTKLAVTDKRFSKLIGSNVACRLVGKKGLKNGNLRWVGHLPHLPLDDAHLIAGVELLTDDKLGTDGTYRGVRYFKSSPKRGYFFRLKDCKAVKH